MDEQRQQVERAAQAAWNEDPTLREAYASLGDFQAEAWDFYQQRIEANRPATRH